MTNDLVKFADGCAFLRISKAAAERHIRDASSDLPRPFRIGRKRWYRQEDLRAYIERKAAAARRPEQAAANG